MKRILSYVSSRLYVGLCAFVLLASPWAQANTVANRSGTIAAANVAQQAMAASISRTYLACQNPIAATTTLFVNIDGAAGATNGSFELAPGGSVTWQAQFVPTGAVSVMSATAGARFVCREG